MEVHLKSGLKKAFLWEDRSLLRACMSIWQIFFPLEKCLFFFCLEGLQASVHIYTPFLPEIACVAFEETAISKCWCEYLQKRLFADPNKPAY